MKRLPLLLALLFTSRTHARRAPRADADDGGITLPPGFRALVYADNLVVGKKVGRSNENLRFLAVAPNGDVYAKGKFGKIWAMRDTDGDGRADKIEEFGPGDGGTHIMFTTAIFTTRAARPFTATNTSPANSSRRRRSK